MRFFDFMRPILFLTAIGVAAGSLTSCNSTQTDPGVAQGVPAIPSTISPGALVGRWGVAAYHRDSDRPRTESEARRQCNNAYNIKAGPTGGVMMHLADESQPGPAALPTDREIVTISDNSFTVKWVSPDNSTRYGTMVYIRCA